VEIRPSRLRTHARTHARTHLFVLFEALELGLHTVVARAGSQLSRDFFGVAGHGAVQHLRGEWHEVGQL
jgi:hypothetical protein